MNTSTDEICAENSPVLLDIRCDCSLRGRHAAAAAVILRRGETGFGIDGPKKIHATLLPLSLLLLCVGCCKTVHVVASRTFKK